MVWQLAAVLVGNKLLLVSPTDVSARLFALVGEEGFFGIVAFTFSRIVIGFSAGLALGVLLALLAGRFRFVEILLWPYMLTVKTVPVASFIVIALIWISASELSALISFLMTLPIIYTNLLEGIRSIDTKMLEMADVFKMPWGSRIRYIWLPSVKPFAISACRIAIGLAWKAGVAAELIGYPDGSIGDALYNSKLSFETVDVFAWTVIIILISVVFEKLFLLLLNKIFGRICER